MNSLENSAQKLLLAYIELVKKTSLKISDVSKAQYNYEVTIGDGRDKVKLQVYFGKKGTKSILQGNKDSKLFNEIDSLLFGESLFTNSESELTEPVLYIGTDESGKGDYFGPLVIAGVLVDAKAITELKRIGVKDSKQLSDKSITKIARQVKQILKNKFSIIQISPKRYNELYSKIGNVNKLLGWAHAKVLENILELHEAAEAISDKFGDESLIVNALQERGKSIKLHQVTKAEKYTAVAAASILARDKFIEWFNLQNKKMNITLPKGASSLVEKAAINIRELYGEERLSELVKLHFKTSKKVFQN